MSIINENKSNTNNDSYEISAEFAKAFLAGKITIPSVFSKEPANIADFFERTESINETTGADLAYTGGNRVSKELVVLESKPKKGKGYKFISFHKKLASYLQKANKMRKPDITGAIVFNTILSWWKGSYRMKCGKKVAFKSYEGLQKDLPFLDRSTIKRAIDRIKTAFPDDFELIKSTKAETNYSITEKLADKYDCNYAYKKKWKDVITFRNDIASYIGVLPAMVYNLVLYKSKKMGGHLHTGYKYVDINISGMADIIPGHPKTIAKAFIDLIDAGLVKKALFKITNQNLYAILTLSESKKEMAQSDSILDTTQSNRWGSERNSNGTQRNSSQKLDNCRYLEIEETTSQAQSSSFFTNTNNIVNTANVEAPPKHIPSENKINIPGTEYETATPRHKLVEDANVSGTAQPTASPSRRSETNQLQINSLLAEEELTLAVKYAPPYIPPSSHTTDNARIRSETLSTGFLSNSHPGTAEPWPETKIESISVNSKEWEACEGMLRMQYIYWEQTASRMVIDENFYLSRITRIKPWFRLLVCPNELVAPVLDMFGMKIYEDLNNLPGLIEFLRTKKEFPIDRLELVYNQYGHLIEKAN
jgi:hypothetical protein